MILVDTSIWVDHFRSFDPGLQQLLAKGLVLSHPFVIGELAMGNLRQRNLILASLHGLPKAIVAHEDEVLRFVRDNVLYGLGVGYIDAHLLAAAKLSPNARLWTRDKRLLQVAVKLSLAY